MQSLQTLLRERFNLFLPSKAEVDIKRKCHHLGLARNYTWTLHISLSR